MNVTSINTIQIPESARTNGLKKAAGNASPPELTEHESKMIKKKFSDTKPVTFYKGNGQKQEQIVAGRGRYLDTKI